MIERKMAIRVTKITTYKGICRSSNFFNNFTDNAVKHFLWNFAVNHVTLIQLLEAFMGDYADFLGLLKA